MEIKSNQNPTTPSGCCFLSCFGAMKTPCSSLKNLVSKIPYVTTVCEKTKYSVTVIKNLVCDVLTSIYHFVLKHLNLVVSKPPITSTEQINLAIDELFKIDYEFPLNCGVYLELYDGKDGNKVNVLITLDHNDNNKKELIKSKLKALQTTLNIPTTDKVYAKMHVFCKNIIDNEETYNLRVIGYSCNKSGQIEDTSEMTKEKYDFELLNCTLKALYKGDLYAEVTQLLQDLPNNNNNVTAAQAAEKACKALKAKDFVKLKDGHLNCYFRTYSSLKTKGQLESDIPSISTYILNPSKSNCRFSTIDYKKKIIDSLNFKFNENIDANVTDFELTISVDIFFKDEKGNYGVHSFCEPHHEDCYGELLRYPLTIGQLQDTAVSLNAPLTNEDLKNLQDLERYPVTLPESKPVQAEIQLTPTEATPQERMKLACEDVVEEYDFPNKCNVYLELSNGKGEKVYTVINLNDKTENKNEHIKFKLTLLQKMVNYLPTSDKVFARMDVFSKDDSLLWESRTSSCNKNRKLTQKSLDKYIHLTINGHLLGQKFSNTLISRLTDNL